MDAFILEATNLGEKLYGKYCQVLIYKTEKLVEDFWCASIICFGIKKCHCDDELIGVGDSSKEALLDLIQELEHTLWQPGKIGIPDISFESMKSHYYHG